MNGHEVHKKHQTYREKWAPKQAFVLYSAIHVNRQDLNIITNVFTRRLWILDQSSFEKCNSFVLVIIFQIPSLIQIQSGSSS